MLGKLPFKISLKRVVSLSALVPALLVGTAVSADDEAPARAQNLLYGEALYEYYQGNAFTALTLLNVGKSKDGIPEHGSHPLLVEGGLMLAYGMTRQAQAHFESVLDETLEASVPAEVRNQAWFYLGKVYYLEQDKGAAQKALERVDVALLADSAPEIYEEHQYLVAQLLLQQSQQSKQASQVALENMDPTQLWPIYLRYNQAVLAIETGDDKALISNQLEVILADLLVLKFEREDLKTEQTALGERIRLTLGQLYLQYEEYEAAERHLKQSSFDGPFAEQALFHFAVAATHREQYGLALAALQRLENRPLFTPWLQQVPYALAYLYEQMGDDVLAVNAYQAAGDHYADQIKSLEQEGADLSEESILKALAMPFQSGEDGEVEDKALQLGADYLGNDAFGRISVKAVDFTYAYVLANETFQLGLRDLHELYKLKSSLSVWSDRLNSFEWMLVTRKAQRAERLETVETSLEAQNVKHWRQAQAHYKQQIEEALKQEDQAFFMDEDQFDFAEQIANVRENLKVLPDDEDKAEYAEKLARIEAYFDWWLADQYGPNRWAAEKQMRALDVAMAEFNQRHEKLQLELSDENFQEELVARVESGYKRLNALSGDLDLALISTRANLIAWVKATLAEQVKEIKRYHLAARHAQARLADSLYQSGQIENAQPAVQPDVPQENKAVVVEEEGL